MAAGSDLAAAGLTQALAVTFWRGAPPDSLRVGDLAVPDELAGLMAVAVWAIVLALHGAYDRSVVASRPEGSRRVLRAGFTFCSLVALVDLVWTTNLPGALVLVITIATTLLTLAGRAAGERAVVPGRAPHRWSSRAVVFGAHADASALARHMARSPHAGVEVVSTSSTPHAPDSAPGPAHTGTNGHGRVSGGGDGVAVDDGVLQVVSSTGADLVAVAAGTPWDRVRSLSWRLEGTGVELMVAPAVADLPPRAVTVHAVGGVPFLRVNGCRMTGIRAAAKAVIDRVGAVLLLVALSPVMLAAALAIKLTSPGPVLYHQTRVGQDGCTFDFIKFRTMVSGADMLMRPGDNGGNGDDVDGLFRIHLADCNEADGLLFKVRDDPRVTPVGRVLRRYSVDELPQLWHVVRGEMSLVGPRPLAVSPDDFAGDARRRLRVKPGITGVWQVSGRRDVNWQDTVELDLDYVDRWSLLVDLKILLRTPAAVLRGRGAY